MLAALRALGRPFGGKESVRWDAASRGGVNRSDRQASGDFSRRARDWKLVSSMIEVVAIDEPALVHELGRAASSRIYVGSLIGDAWQRIDPADARATFKLLHSETPWVVAPSGLPDGVRDARKWPAQNRW